MRKFEFFNSIGGKRASRGRLVKDRSPARKRSFHREREIEEVLRGIGAVEEEGRHADRGAFGAARSIGKARNGAGARETQGPRQMTLSSA
jgi:hypothetical protein